MNYLLSKNSNNIQILQFAVLRQNALLDTTIMTIDMNDRQKVIHFETKLTVDMIKPQVRNRYYIFT